MENLIYDKNAESGLYAWDSLPNRDTAYKLKCSHCGGDNFIRVRNSASKPALKCSRCDKEYSLPEGIDLEVVEASDDMMDFAEAE